MESLELFFLECCYDSDKTSSSFLVGPYRNISHANARSEWLQNQDSPRRILGVKMFSAEKLSGENCLINGTRLYNLAHLPNVRRDGAIKAGRAEMVFAIDYFSSSGELV